MSITLLTSYRGSVLILEGDNFSGRTELLRGCVADRFRKGHQAVYLGPCAHRYFSSLMPNVYDELHIHASGTRHEKSLFSFAESLGLMRCFSQNPFVLSGGEQVLLAIFSKLALEPEVLALDGTLGELDRINKIRVAQILASPIAENINTLVTENGYRTDRMGNLPIRRPIEEFVTTATTPPRFCASDFRFVPSANTGCLEAEDICFSYRAGSSLLHGVRFQLQPGRIYSLEGRNGAGKSTLAQILVGALPVQRGRISFSGRTLEPWKSPGQTVVMQTQNPDFQLFSDSVDKELSDLPRFSSAARLAGVEDLIDEHPFDLPFVLRKRLTFSIIAHLRRPWFIFDEPTVGQDIRACEQMVMILQKMAKNGAGIIVISHSQEFIHRLEAKRLWLEEGFIREL